MINESQHVNGEHISLWNKGLIDIRNERFTSI